MKADEAYLIGEPGHPVARTCPSRRSSSARRAGADAIYPATGFFPRPALARACEEAGITSWAVRRLLS